MTSSPPRNESPPDHNDADSKSHPPPARPPLRSNFDLEPNPFEQSFSTSASSVTPLPKDAPESGTAANGNQQQPPSQPTSHQPLSSAAESSKPVLPPLAAIASPSDFTWGFPTAGLSNSLRAGPLSPAMLAGPTQQSSSTSSYNPAVSVFGRTGFTPGTGLTPLVGGPASFPPPSPNTAAFLAMVASGANGTIPPSSSTITPNTLAAITGVYPAPAANASNTASATNGVSSQHPLATSHVPIFERPAYQYNSSSGQQQDAYTSSAASAANAAANGLFLLSQAHQELTKREEAQRLNAVTSTNGKAVPVQTINPAAATNNASNRRGAKRKTTADPAPAPTAPTARNKRARGGAVPAATHQNLRHSDELEDDDSGLDDDDVSNGSLETNQPNPQRNMHNGGTANATTGGGRNANKKPETEEEKRKNFLERNRQAALKCRQRKKAWLAQLQAKVEYLTNENERLTSALVSSREEISRLNALVNASAAAVAASHHSAAGVGPGVPAVGPGLGHPVSVSVSLPAGGKGGGLTNGAGPTPVAVGAGGGRYSY